jgi:hypothetical protein
MNEDSITGIYCYADGFCNALEGYYRTHLLSGRNPPKWFQAGQLALSEVMTVIVLFHLSGYRCFKWYYHRHVCIHMRGCFSAMASYNQFVELKGYVLIPLLLYTQGFRRGH